MTLKKKSLSAAFLTAIIISGLFLVSAVHFGTVHASTSVSGIITSDTTWTQANSPYSLTGNVLVNNGVTLTIEAGVTVNLNSHYLMVNGTLRMQGSSSDKVYFNGGETGGNITFTQFSRGWDNQTDSGSTIENAILNQITVSSSKPLKITNTILNGEIAVGDSSLISNNVILGRKYSTSNPYAITTGNSSIISNNIINGTEYSFAFFGPVYLCYAINAGESSLISNNVIAGDVSGNSIIVTNNNILGRTIGNSIIVSNNIIIGPKTLFWDGGVSTSISAVYSTGSSSTIFNNTIYCKGYSAGYYTSCYGISVQSGFANISGNTISNSITGIRAAGDCIIEENLITNNTKGIEVGRIYISNNYHSGNAIIRNNNIINNSFGISSSSTGGSATIENNLIFNNTNGIDIVSQATIKGNLIFYNLNGIVLQSQGIIQNNTITNNSIGIKITNPLPTIVYNNIQDNSIYNLQLGSNVQNDIYVPNNWWGTTNSLAINQTIYDFKNDFNLGKVDFTPFLNETNPQAPVVPTFTITASAGAGGSITPSGSVVVNYGDTPTFTFTPATGYHVADVLVDTVSVGHPDSYQFSPVSVGHSISVSFAINTYTITPSAGSNGAISPSSVQTVNWGATSSFTVTPATGYHILDVQVDGVSVLGSLVGNVYTFQSVVANHEISASFAINTYTITVTQVAHGMIAPGTGSVNYGNTPSYTVTPDVGYHIASITANGGAVTITSPTGQTYQFSSVTADGSLTATFAINTYAITVTQGANGVIAPGTTTVNYGGSQAFTITPNTGYYIASITADAGAVTVTSPSGQTVSFTNVQATHTLTATFALTPTPTPTPDSGGGGGGSSTTSTPTPTPAPTPSATTVPATTDTGATVDLAISGNVTSTQMSNVTIATNQSVTTTTVSFTVTGESGTTGFGNVTVPKSAVPYGTTPTIYIDGQPAQDQGYTQDTNNYYVWYTTHFSTHKVSIVFTTTAPSPTPTAQSSLPQEAIYGVAATVAIVAIVAVVLVLRKSKKGKS